MNKTFLEKRIDQLLELVKLYTDVIASSLIAALFAHTFALTNKLIIPDETTALFSKGATVTSGRWALELTKFLFPNVSIPWLYGLISILLLTASACIIVHIFDIKSKVLRCIFGALFISFPTVTGFICYMFTSASYSLATLIASLGMAFAVKQGTKNTIISVVLLAFAIGIYQMFILFAASFFIVYLIKRLLVDCVDEKDVFRNGLFLFAALVFSFLLYFVILKIVCAVSGIVTENAEYSMATTSIPRRFITTYSAMFGIFFKGYFGFVNGKTAAVIHTITVLCLIAGVIYLWKGRKRGVILLSVFLFGIWPIAANGLYLAASPGLIHVVSQFSFISYYMLLIIFAERIIRLKDIVTICLSLVVILNIYSSNATYLQLKLNYDAGLSYYTTLFSTIYNTEGYRSGMNIVFIGQPQNGIYYTDDNTLTLPYLVYPLQKFYTIQEFINYYLGIDADVTTQYNLPEALSDMNIYPDYGGVRIIDNTVFVRFE